ncbi:MAG: hypothetical protein A2508_06255 [Candidatus Lambdaproteobacteria bacterium RIFOXYD12_FULL_49_8]|nr:MAG: hypothetical protein A2508_06255 [Candidatus Lambdaproteobacteria bacterium RIFOXYD12_FULL_49_8]
MQKMGPYQNDPGGRLGRILSTLVQTGLFCLLLIQLFFLVLLRLGGWAGLCLVKNTISWLQAEISA